MDSVLAEIERQFGDVVRSGTAVIEENRAVIPVSPALDPMLGGGVPEGSWVTASGRFGCGKTTVALRFAANAQKPEYGSRPVFYFSIESRWEEKNARGTRGLIATPPHFNVVESTDENILRAEDHLKIAALVLNSVPRAVLILDSPSMFSTSDAAAEGVEHQNRGGANKLFGEFIRQNAAVCRVRRSVVWSNIHLARSQGQFAGWDEKIAETANYAAGVKIKIRYTQAWKVGDKQVGQVLKWRVDKSALSGPGGEADGYLRYGIGVDDDMERLTLGVELGLVTKSGAWYSLDFLPEPRKVQGLEGAWALLQERPELSALLADRIRGVVA